MSNSSYSVFIRHTGPNHAIAFWSKHGKNSDLPDVLPERRNGVGASFGMMRRRPTAKELLQIQWNYRHQPHLGFIPAEPFFEGPIWGRFNGDFISFKSLIRQNEEGFWEFDYDTRNSWARMETALVPLIKLINDPKIPHSLQAPLRPRDTSFWEPRDSQQRVLGSVLFAQRLFMELAGELSYAISTSQNDIDWVPRVLATQKEHGLCYPEDWLRELQRSKAIRTVDTNRVGYLLDTKEMRNTSEIWLYDFFKIPCFVAFADIAYFKDIDPFVTSRLQEGVRPPAPILTMIAELHREQCELAKHIRESEETLREEREEEEKRKAAMEKIALKAARLSYRLPMRYQRAGHRFEPFSTDDATSVPNQPSPSPIQETFSQSWSPYNSPAHFPPHPNDSLESPESPPPQSPPFSFSPSLRMDSPFYDFTLDDYPEPEPNSGQAKGQTWQDFFAERRESNKFEEDNETERQRQRRLERKRAAEQHNQPAGLPNSLKAPVFTWKRTSHPDITLRCLVEKSEVEYVWEDFYPTQRLYDEFNNEWDLCPHIEVDKTLVSQSLRDYIDSLNDGEPILGSLPDLGIQTCTVGERALEEADLDIQPRTVGERALEEAQGPGMPPDFIEIDQREYWKTRLFPWDQLPLFHSLNPKNYAKHRFGLRFSSPVNVNVSNVNWSLALGICIANAASKNLEGDMAVREFVAILNSIKKAKSNEKKKSEKDSKQEVESEKVLVQDTPLDPNILRQLVGKIDIHPETHVLLGPSPIRIRCVNARHGLERFYLYFFSFEDEHHRENEWTLAVRSAANAVLAIREQWGTTRDNLVHNFLRYGIPFHTLQKCRPINAKITIPDIKVAELAKKDRRYNLEDYLRYQDLREDFFDSPFGGVAGRSGGIIARLWREDSRKFDQRMKRILAGPTLFSSLGGYIVDCGELGVYYDDQLTESMIHIVSGAYLRPDRGQIAGRSDWDKLEKPSWYPTQTIYHSKCLPYVGRWTDRDEEWLLSRRVDILYANEKNSPLWDQSQPKKAMYWSTHNKGLRPGTKPTDSAYEPLAHNFLVRFEGIYKP